MSIQQIDREFVAGTYSRFPVTVVSGKGSLVQDENGKEYIDLGTGIAVNSFGVADELWQKAVTEQISRVQHMSNLYYTEPCARLAEQLCRRTGMRKVFFSNSGAEANECAIKVARKWACEVKGPEYSTIVTLKNSFHGRTLTTLAATGQEHYHELFQPLTPGFVHTTAGDIEELRRIFAEHKVAGVLIECIQGEGGVLPLEAGYARALEALVRENNALLMVDEVQTGNGRTGRLYGYMNFGLQPDVVSTAKGLGGGLPLGATLLGERVQNVLGFGDHGSTFGGNPVCCAGALSILSRIDDALLESVRAKGEFIRKSLEGAPGVQSVAGMGLMLGVKTVKPAGEVVRACTDRGVLCLTAKDKVRLLPALNIPMELLEKAVAVIKDVCAPA
ncbi:MAG: acetylornithine/succinylornithine family transaminase [Duodenibacillus sp.]|nr:acetylornithine/succinylornithine family transaminase [Duodenibacillus sp.]